jgi:hypothetical protein
VLFFAACRNVFAGPVSNLAGYRVQPCVAQIDFSFNFNDQTLVLSRSKMMSGVSKGRREGRKKLEIQLVGCLGVTVVSNSASDQ